jgi:hypothetical protein
MAVEVEEEEEANFCVNILHEFTSLNIFLSPQYVACMMMCI